MNVYLDSSAIVKLFDSREPHHEFLRDGLMKLAPDLQFTSVLAFPETLAAFAGKKYSINQLNKINALFLHVWEQDYSKIDLDQEICNVSGILVRTHRSLGLRGADSVHLASALRVGAKRSSLTFVVFDRNLAKAASAEGFPLLTNPSFGLPD